MHGWGTAVAAVARLTLATFAWSAGTVWAPPTAGAQAPPPLRRYHHTVWPLGEAPLGPFASIVRSPDGYLWAGARTALVRFDGVRFAQLDGTSVPALRVTGTVGRGFQPLRVDRLRRLWVRRPDGALVTYADGVFHVMLEPARAPVQYTDLYEDGAGGLWVGADSAEHRWIRRLRGDRPLPGTWPAGVPETDVTRVVADSADGMWVGTSTRGLWHVTPRGTRAYDLPAAVCGAARDCAVYPELQSTDGNVWVSTATGLQRMRGGTWTTVALHGDRSGGVSAGRVTQAPDGSVYIAGRNYGVLRWREGHLERRPPGDGPAGVVVHDVVADADGTIWASTDIGLERFRRAAFMTLGRRDGVPFDVPYELYGDASGALWVSDRTDRLYRLRRGSMRASSDSMQADEVPVPAGINFQIIAGARRGVWIAPRLGGLARADRSGLTTLGPSAGLPPNRIVAGVEDASGGQWVGVYSRGVGRLRNRRFAPVRLPGAGDNVHATFATGDAGRSVIITDADAPRAYAVAPSGAVTRLDSLAPLRHPVEAPAVEGPDTVWAVALRRSEISGAAQPALVRLTGGRATEVPLPGPVPALTGFNVQLAVADGALWFASGDGVGRLPLAALHHAADRGLPAPTPQTFGPPDGLVAARLTLYGMRRMFRALDGRLWLATPAGVAVVDPAAVPVNPTPPPVHVEEITVGGRLVPTGELQRIAPNPERIAIRYTAASLRMPERVRVQYRLDGADPGWIEGTVPRVASYTQLRPGYYRFRVRAWNEDGVPSRGEATVALRVLPAWYQTAWAAALGLAAVAGLGASAAGVVAGVRRRRAEAAQQATVAERLRVARELHDTILGDLAGLTMRLDAAAAATERLDDALLPGLRDQARRTLDETRLAVTAMRATAPGDIPLWAQLSAAAHQVFATAPVRMSVRHTGTSRQIAPTAAAEVLRIATEALVNAQAHSRCHAVTVTCAFGRSTLEVVVRDDGRGFDPERDGVGAMARGHWGLAGMHERARTLGGALTVDSAPGRGTTVRLRVPTPPASHTT